MIAILIQSRIGSTRLPKKALLPLGDSTMLGQVIRRCKKACVDKVIVVSPDEEILTEAIKEGADISKFTLGERDVLAEMYTAALTYEVDTIVRITGDCPCISPREINQMVGFFEEESCDIMYNNTDCIGGGLDGLDIEVFSFTALRKAYLQAEDEYDRKHVCPWMYKNLKSSRAMFCWDFDAKLSVDTKADYEFIYDLYNELGSDFETIEIEKFVKGIEK